MSVFVEDILALLRHVRWDTFNLIGFSFGGALAQELMLKQSSGLTFQRVLLVCPASDVDQEAGGEGSGRPQGKLAYDPEQESLRRAFLQVGSGEAEEARYRGGALQPEANPEFGTRPADQGFWNTELTSAALA